ncbi:MAG: hypothetical protein ACR2P7_09645 [bacterium]
MLIAGNANATTFETKFYFTVSCSEINKDPENNLTCEVNSDTQVFRLGQNISGMTKAVATLTCPLLAQNLTQHAPDEVKLDMVANKWQMEVATLDRGIVLASCDMY